MAAQSIRVLTGITTTGTPHLGNYVGAIRPAIASSASSTNESFFFLADYHALVKCPEPERLRRSTLEIAATWLALGLDTTRAIFYRQSDVPQITELTWILSPLTSKGLMNRAHAYKAAVQENLAAELDADHEVSMGLFNYPILMAADILLFRAHRVPVGRDQIQHLEMARDIAQRFNHRYEELFPLPEAAIDEAVEVLPGLDGRKMSKSYDNAIALFGPARQLRKAIMRIVTNSKEPGEPKQTDESAVYPIYAAFASAEERAQMREDLAAGLAWGEAKQRLFEKVDEALAPARDRYHELLSEPEQVEAVLADGAARARAVADPFVRKVRRAVGISSLD